MGPDVRFGAAIIGADDRVEVRISGGVPGVVELLLDPDHEAIIARMDERQLALFARCRDELNDAGCGALAEALQQLCASEAVSRNVGSVQVHYEERLVVHVGSLQGETLGRWAERVGRRLVGLVAEAVFSGSVARRMGGA